MMYSKATCISLLIEKQKEINACGISRFPKKSDFTDEQVQATSDLGREHLNKRG